MLGRPVRCVYPCTGVCDDDENQRNSTTGKKGHADTHTHTSIATTKAQVVNPDCSVDVVDPTEV